MSYKRPLNIGYSFADAYLMIPIHEKSIWLNAQDFSVDIRMKRFVQ